VRRPLLALLAVLLGVSLAPYPAPPATASCVGPYLKDAEDLVLHRGDTVTVHGRAFAEGCRDTMTCSGWLGCDHCEYNDPPPQPMTDVALVLRQRGRTWTLATADARTAEDNQLGWATWTFELPDDVQPGRARLLPESSEPVPVQIR
jgi:hypothetical protein